MHHIAKSDLFGYARAMRDNMTKAEMVLWEELKNRKLNGFKFRRQHPIHTYILDFYCHEFKLVIEIDGDYHLEKYQKWYDEDRTAFLKEVGLTEVRFTNNQVLTDIGFVLEEIKKYLK